MKDTRPSRSGDELPEAADREIVFVSLVASLLTETPTLPMHTQTMRWVASEDQEQII